MLIAQAVVLARPDLTNVARIDFLLQHGGSNWLSRPLRGHLELDQSFRPLKRRHFGRCRRPRPAQAYFFHRVTEMVPHPASFLASVQLLPLRVARLKDTSSPCNFAGRMRVICAAVRGGISSMAVGGMLASATSSSYCSLRCVLVSIDGS